MREDRISIADARGARKVTVVSLVTKIFLVLILVIATLFFATKLMEYNKLAREREALEKQIGDTRGKVSDLQHEYDAPIDASYAESYAKDKLDMNYPDETVYYNDGVG